MKQEVFEHDGALYKIKIGRNAKENTEIVKEASEFDVWFHMKDSPSCHVVLENNIQLKQVPRTVLKHCGFLCRQHSKVQLHCDIIYTQIKNVKVTIIPGQVIIKNYKQLS